MDLPAGLLTKYKTPKGPRSQREELLQQFLEKINASRGKYPAITIGRLVKLFEGVPTSDLHGFYRQCEEARSFSRLFWFKIKPINL